MNGSSSAPYLCRNCLYRSSPLGTGFHGWILWGTSYLIGVDIFLHLVVELIHVSENVFHLLIWLWLTDQRLIYWRQNTQFYTSTWIWRDCVYICGYPNLGWSLASGEGLHVALLRLLGFREVVAHHFWNQPWPPVIIPSRDGCQPCQLRWKSRCRV